MAEIQAPAAAVVAPGNGERLTLEEWAEYFKFQRGRDSPGEARNGLLVIAVLITTATYQAVLSPPGGFWQETKADEKGVNGQKGVKGHQAGKTIFSDYAFLGFIISNTAGFFGSLLLIEILTEGFPLQLELWFTILTLVVSYEFAMYSIISDDKLATVFLVCSLSFPFLLEYAAKKIRKARHQGRNIWDIC